MKPTNSPYRHVVFFKFNPEALASTVKAIESAFVVLATKLPFVTGFEWSLNSSPENLDQGFTHCFLVSFASPADRDAYLPHPEHQAFCRTWLDPWLEKVCVLDYQAKIEF